MEYLGCSYGNLILYNSDHCLLVDVFSGTTMRPPRLKFTDSSPNISYGVLDGPINSSNSHLLLCSSSAIFKWQVGSNSWLEHPVDIEGITQIVFLEGKMYAMDCFDGIHTICLATRFSAHEVEVYQKELRRGAVCRNLMKWLVACDDMLLLVDLSMGIDNLPGLSVTFRVFSLDLDFCGVYARWVELENLGNRSIFVSFDTRSPALCYTSPERWGGKSNCIYVANQSEDSDEPWRVVKLGQLTRCETWRCLNFEDGEGERPENLWVLPSLVYDIGR